MQEWLGPNRCDYECFVDNTEEYDAEFRNFLQGYYNSDLGNTMPLAMANALHVSFVIFTSLIHLSSL